MKITARLESGIYIAAFLLIAIITLTMCSYLTGRTDELVREDHEQNQIVDQAIADSDYWRGKYQSLANEADAVTILAAESKYQLEARQ